MAISAEENTTDGNFEVNTDQLFESAWKYQNLMTELQTSINVELFEVRTGINGVLRRTTNVTLSQIEENSKTLIQMDQEVFNQLNKNDLSQPCFGELIQGKNTITYMADTQSTNKIRAYNNAINALINGTFIDIDKYNNWLTDIQLSVVRSFNLVQVFVGPKIIKNNFENQYNNIKEEWDAVKPDAKANIEKLETNIMNQNKMLVENFSKIYDAIKIKYEHVIESMEICIEFSSYTPLRAIQAAKTRAFFPKDKFIPQFD
jgi:hypothetical protein